MLARIIIIYLFLLVGIGGFALPVSAQSQDDFFKVCWTRDQCLSDGADKDSSKNSEKGSKYEFVPGANLPSGDVCRVQGQENEVGRCYYKPSLIDLNVKIPLIGNVKEVLSNKYFSNSKVRQDKKSGEIKAVAGFPVYIALLYAYFTSIAGIVAVTVMAYGGYQWMVAGGNADKISQAKSTIQGAFAGLVLVLGSYVILDQINSKLVMVKDLRVERIKPIILASRCTELKGLGIEDLVSKRDPVKRTPEEAKCGIEYYSESNPTLQCIGMDCSNKQGKPYCVSDEKKREWKCVSKDTLFNLCKGESRYEDCVAVDEQFVITAPRFVCSYVLAAKRCVVSNLYVPPKGFKRINCRDGAPVCFDKERNFNNNFCKDLEVERVGNTGWNNICVQQEACLTNKPTDPVDCSSFGLKDGCEYIKYGDCWKLVGFSKIIKTK